MPLDLTDLTPEAIAATKAGRKTDAIPSQLAAELLSDDKPTDAELTLFAAELLGYPDYGDEKIVLPASWVLDGETILSDSLESQDRTFDPTKCRNDDADVQQAMAKRRDAGEWQLWEHFSEALYTMNRARRRTRGGRGTLRVDAQGDGQTGDYTRAACEAMKGT